MLAIIKDTIKSFLVRRSRFKAIRCKDLEAGNRILILAPHPDDEVFGCGGLIKHLVDNGIQPNVVVMSGGGASHKSCCDVASDTIIENRRMLTRKALYSLRVKPENIHFLDFTDSIIGDRPQSEMSRLKGILESVNPDTLFLPHHGEGWPDHLAVREIGLDMAPESCSVYEYCVWWWFYRQSNPDWKKAYSLKMTPAEHKAKLNAIQIYSNASAPCGKPWIGVLPNLFVKANSDKVELFFKVR